MKFKKHPKYPHQRVEQRQNIVDTKSIKEQRQMEQNSNLKISIGTLTFLPPKSNSEISNFTLAFPKPIPKADLYLKLHQVFNGHWDGEPTKSVYIQLSKPIPLHELRQKLKDNFEKIFVTKDLKTNPS